MSELLKSGMMPGRDYFVKRRQQIIEERGRRFDAKPLQYKIDKLETALVKFSGANNVSLFYCQELIRLRVQQIKEKHCA